MTDLFTLPVPTEDDEQFALIQWLDLVGLKYTAIPNHTYNPHRSQQAKNHRLGLRKGFPDLVVVIPADISKDGTGHLLALEMKRMKGSTTSTEQKAWVNALNGMGADGVEAHICKGADAAIGVITRYVHPQTNISPF